jgi:hypothetical protein
VLVIALILPLLMAILVAILPLIVQPSKDIVAIDIPRNMYSDEGNSFVC